LSNPRGLTYHKGMFIQADYLLNMVMEINREYDFSTVYIAPQRLYEPGHAYWLPYISSHSLEHTNAAIRRILVFQHGIGDDAVEHYGRAFLAANAKGLLNETLILAPQLIAEDKLNSEPPPDMLYWALPNPRFWGALSAPASATYPRAHRFSAFALYDQLLASLVSDSTRFPYLEEIVLSGHSGGGQFINRYAVSSSFEDGPALQGRHVDMIYIVMNPGSYVYHDELRVDFSSLEIESGQIHFITPTNPPAGYNNFGYGLDNLYSYHGANDPVALRSQYPQRKVIYLIGDLDTGSQDLDVDARAMLQGANRYERSLIYYEHLKAHYGSGNLPRHRHDIVSGVGHNSRLMITSDIGLRYHFQGSLRIDSISMAANGAEMSVEWRGGEGRADVLLSEDLQSWWSSSIATNTPITVPASNTRRFIKLKEISGP